MGTAQDLITSSMKLLGLVGIGETPTDDELQSGLAIFNIMLDGFPRNIVNARTLEGFTLTAGTGAYSMGTNTTRAVEIEDAYIRDASNVDTHVLLITKSKYNSISDKTTQGRPHYLMYDPQYSLGEIYLYPIPDISYTLYTDSWKPLSSVAAITTTISFPPGYDRFFKFNLAIELAADFGVDIPPSVILIANESKKNIERVNAQRVESDLGIPAHRNSVFNINSLDYE